MDQTERDLWALSQYSKILTKELQYLSFLQALNRLTFGRLCNEEIALTEGKIARCREFQDRIYDRY